LQHCPSPFAYLGLWRNPFGELSPAERAELAIVDVAPLVEFLTSARSAVQFVGDCGYGKTTHLLALQTCFPRSQLVYYPETGRRPPLPQGTPLLVDEAQRMGWKRKRQLLKSTGSVALGTHRDLAPELRRAGFDVWTIDVAEPKEPAGLVQILRRRIDASRVGSNWSQRELRLSHCIDEDFARKLIVRFGSNTRRIEDYLYDDLQKCIQEKRDWPRAFYE
jgi:hypothetical protein